MANNFSKIAEDVLLMNEVVEHGETIEPLEMFAKGSRSLPECEHEGSTNCFWNGAKRGGMSYVVIDRKLGGIYQVDELGGIVDHPF